MSNVSFILSERAASAINLDIYGSEGELTRAARGQPLDSTPYWRIRHSWIRAQARQTRPGWRRLDLSLQDARVLRDDLLEIIHGTRGGYWKLHEYLPSLKHARKVLEKAIGAAEAMGEEQ